MKPYEDLRSNGQIIREFKSNVHPEDLVWHQDKEHRIVKIVEGTGWKLQIDSGLPFSLKEGESYYIPARTWHRILKGNSSLKILISEIRTERSRKDN